MKHSVFENNFFYRPWETLRVFVRLDRTVREEPLQASVQLASKRYPYFCVKVVRNGEHHELLFNEKPVPVYRGRTPLRLGSEEANGHFIAAGWEADELFFDVYHNMCDVSGLLPWIRTILYLYLRTEADPDLDPTGIRLPGDPFLENETVDPYENLVIPDDLPPFVPGEKSGSFVMDSRYSAGKNRFLCFVRVSADGFMRFSRLNRSTPAVTASYFLKETVKRLFPERNGRAIRIVVPHTLADDLCGIENYHHQLTAVEIEFDEQKDRLPVEEQLNEVHDSLNRQKEHCRILSRIQSMIMTSDELDGLKTVEEKRAWSRKFLELLKRDPETMVVTYPGQTPWYALSPYLKEAYIHCTVPCG